MDHRAAIETVGLVVDAAGVAVIVIAFAGAGFGLARALIRHLPFEPSYRHLRLSMGERYVRERLAVPSGETRTERRMDLLRDVRLEAEATCDYCG